MPRTVLFEELIIERRREALKLTLDDLIATCDEFIAAFERQAQSARLAYTAIEEMQLEANDLREVERLTGGPAEITKRGEAA